VPHPPQSDQDALSVVVPTYRRPDALRRCLQALEAQVEPAASVVVVIRQGDRGTLEVAESFRSRLPLTLVCVQASGVVAALNSGLARVCTPLVAFTDDDAAPRPDWVRRIREHFRDPRVGGVGGRDVIHVEGDVRDEEVSRVGRILWFGRMVGNHHCRGARQEVAFLKGVNMSYRTRLVPGFDTRLAGAGAQTCYELQASLRIRAAGWRLVWDPQVAVDHFPAERFEGEPRGRASRRGMIDDIENQTYVLLSVLRGWRRVIAVAYGVMVGTRAAPGPVLAVAMLLAFRSWPAVLRGLAINLSGRARGFRTWAGRRDQPVAPPYASARVENEKRRLGRRWKQLAGDG